MCLVHGTSDTSISLHSVYMKDSLKDFIWKFAYGLTKIIPLFIWTHLVGLGIEFFFAARKGHGIEEGFLVTGALIPLIMPPDVPIWILCMAVTFAVIIGKEAFGGTGMNIWNIALLARVFVFFAYPTTISGDEVWVAGIASSAPGALADYGWWQTGFFNPMFDWLGWTTFDPAMTVVDGFTGATPLSLAYQGGWEAVTQVYSQSEIFWGTIPGSVGETSKPLIILGALGSDRIRNRIMACYGRYAHRCDCNILTHERMGSDTLYGSSLVQSIVYGKLLLCNGVYGDRPGHCRVNATREMALRNIHWDDRNCHTCDESCIS